MTTRLRSLVALCALGLVATAGHAQTGAGAGYIAADPDTLSVRYQVYDAGGEAFSLDAMLGEAAQADVVFVGEIHDDPTAHAIELATLAGLVQRAAPRPVVLAMEMFETDVQTVLDEYTAGVVSERDMLGAARPWDNYADYRPLVEFAKANGVPVVGSNAPVRYVRLVAREGVESLSRLSTEGQALLPALPIVTPSEAMSAAFAEVMGDMSGHGGPSLDGMLAAQNLRDATMAQSIAEALTRPDRPLVVHVSGGFHTEGGRGIPEHLARLAPQARRFLIAVEPTTDVDAVPTASGSDATVQTEARLVPSRN